MKTLRALALTAALSAYALATLGSWTRINGAGMACPDWPLCHGAIVPVLQGGVVLEWLHRAVALVVSLLVVIVIVAALRVRAAVPAVVPMVVALAAAMVLQVALGGVTIFAANSPPSVTMHWGAAMLLLAVLTSITVVAFAAQDGRGSARGKSISWHASRLTWSLAATALVAFATMCIGAYVSSSGAGLACPGFPRCGAAMLGPQQVQMAHRGFATLLLLAATLTTLGSARADRRTLVALRIALALVALQILLGILAVVLSLPPGIREAHAANAGLTFLAFVVAAVLSALQPSKERVERSFDYAPSALRSG